MRDLRLLSGRGDPEEPRALARVARQGIYGPTRYACGNHRGELKALLREQYGMLGWHPWAKGPHPWAGRRGTDRARRLRRTLVAGLGR